MNILTRVRKGIGPKYSMKQSHWKNLNSFVAKGYYSYAEIVNEKGRWEKFSKKVKKNG
jgi:hypothetical protein